MTRSNDCTNSVKKHYKSNYCQRASLCSLMAQNDRKQSDLSEKYSNPLKVSHLDVEINDKYCDMNDENIQRMPCSPAINKILRHSEKILISPKVILLDGQNKHFEITTKDPARVLLDKVCTYLKLEEKIFFGLYFRDTSNRKIWLNLNKSLVKQIKNNKINETSSSSSSSNWIFVFRLKFYPTSVKMIKNDLTLYYIGLQIRIDILSGKLMASQNILINLCSHIVQSEVGDYQAHLHTDIHYIQGFNFVHKQSSLFLQKVALAHRNLLGISPCEADRHIVLLASQLNQYGQHYQIAVDDTTLQHVVLAVSPWGLCVLNQNLVIHSLLWQQILKIKTSGRIFAVNVLDSVIDASKSLDGSNLECDEQKMNEKHKTLRLSFRLKDEKTNSAFLSLVVEHHIFFRIRFEDSSPLESVRDSKEHSPNIIETSNLIKSPETYSKIKKSQKNSFHPNIANIIKDSQHEIHHRRQNSSLGSANGISDIDSINNTFQSLAHSSAIYESDFDDHLKILPIVIEEKYCNRNDDEFEDPQCHKLSNLMIPTNVNLNSSSMFTNNNKTINPTRNILNYNKNHHELLKKNPTNETQNKNQDSKSNDILEQETSINPDDHIVGQIQDKIINFELANTNANKFTNKDLLKSL